MLVSCSGEFNSLTDEKSVSLALRSVQTLLRPMISPTFDSKVCTYACVKEDVIPIGSVIKSETVVQAQKSMNKM